MSERRIFVAGSTGAVGRTLLALPETSGPEWVPHVRPKTAAQSASDARAAVLDLSDGAALVTALAGVTTVVQLIGTMRRRFGSGDTYETSDIGTTRQLVDAARAAKGVDHFVLLSSVGAGKPIGAYLAAKAKTESLVVESGLPHTIFRPSAFDGGGHRPPPGMRALTRVLGARRYEPIAIESLASAIAHVAQTRSALGQVLEGESLWEVVASATASDRR